MTPLDTHHPYGLCALGFAQALAAERFEEAHAMLSAGSRQALAVADLQQDFLQMIDYGDGPADVCEVMIVDDGMPKKTAADLAWVYVAICGPGFSEAVAVTVLNDDDGALKLRIEDWGRP